MLKRILTLLMIITSLPIDLSYSSPRLRDNIAAKRADNLNYKLSENVFPEHYTLKISPEFDNKTFTGYIKILIHVKIPTSNITLHKKYLNITKEKIYLTTKDDLVINIKDAGESGTEEQEFYTITFTEILNQNSYYLHIPEFHGHLLGSNKGFRYAHYIDKNGQLRKFATSFFESTGARLAFPCFDEPSFRAKFKIYIVRPRNYHSLSNTKLIKSIKLNNSLYEDEFDVTVSMPTYLVAFIVSEMKLSTMSADSNFFRILARPEVLAKGYEKISFQLSVKLLQAFETYLNVNYTLNKMDQVIIPDNFIATAGMENWGLISYKESFFLITPQTTTKEQLHLATIVAHEFAHQWFGNLVAIKWWRYLWLKEGFAMFFQCKIFDIVKPEWRMMEQCIAMDKRNILEQDSFVTNRNMNQDAGTPTEISSLYDRISYDKASYIIHMLETIMTPNIFRHGITNYLRDRAFQSATPDDLYRNLQKSLDNSAIKLPQNLNIKKIMTTWVSQPGFPLVYVQRDFGKNQTVVKLTQSLFVKKQFDTPKPTTWYIPISYASKRNPNFNDTRFSNWLLKPEETITVSNLKCDDWLILNKQGAFYYRVNYDVQNWKLIAKAFKENYRSIHLLNRAQIIEDSFNLAKLDKIDFSIPLKICTYVHQEDDYIIHSVFLGNMHYIEKIIYRTNVEPKFQQYVMQSLKRPYRRLGNNHRPSDTVIDKLHRTEVVNWMCKFSYSQCRAESWKIFDQWRKTNESIEVDLENDIMCNAIRHGNEDDWNYLFGKYTSASDDKFEKKAFQWLSCTENVSILLHFIESSLNPSQKYIFTDVVRAICNKGPVGFNLSKQYVIEHFSYLESTLSTRFMELILLTINEQLRTAEEVDNFRNSLPKNISLDMRWKLTFDSARLYISEEKKHIQQISKFFQSYNPSDGSRSDGNLCQVTRTIYYFNLYVSIIFVIFVYN